jgi:GntR family transcriptional regulator, arabinose operon transcriptional repressor
MNSPMNRMKQSKSAAGANTALKQAPMHRVIYDTLLAQIQQGQYRSGDRLPSELELCKRFQSSRITVAKAINSLQHEGLVVRRAGSGSYVQLAAPVTSYQFGLLIPELGSTEIFEPICQGIMQSPQAKSHSLIWGHTSHKTCSKEEAALSLCRQFIEQKVSGVFFAPLEFVDEKDSINHQLVAELRQAGIPIVLLDRCYYTYPMRSNLDRVGIDNHRASFVVTQHLWNQGARRIVFVARRRSASTMVDRVSGYQFALGECGSEFPARALYGDVENQEFVRELVEVEPDGVVCGNDLTAAHLMRALIGMGVRVPEQIRLVSFDDVSYAKFLPVPLTTIHQNCPQIGELAMRLMLDRIQHPLRPGIDLLVPFDLVVRESCGPAGEANFTSGFSRRASADPASSGARKSAVKRRIASRPRAV